jgi:hypothetical protein
MAESNEAAVRARLAAEADKVMNESRPTPTQAEVDAVRTGNHDDRPADDNPTMRPLHEQRAMIEEAKNADQKAATAEPEQALYRTRAMTPRPRAQAEPTDQDGTGGDGAARSQRSIARGDQQRA